MSGPELSGDLLSGAWPGGGEWLLAVLAGVYIAWREARHRRRHHEQVATRREPS